MPSSSSVIEKLKPSFVVDLSPVQNTFTPLISAGELFPLMTISYGLFHNPYLIYMRM